MTASQPSPLNRRLPKPSLLEKQRRRTHLNHGDCHVERSETSLIYSLSAADSPRFFASLRMTNMNAKLLLRSAAAAGGDALLALATRDDEMIVIAVASPGTRRHIPNFHKLPVGDIGRR